MRAITLPKHCLNKNEKEKHLNYKNINLLTLNATAFNFIFIFKFTTQYNDIPTRIYVLFSVRSYIAQQ